MTPIKVCPRLWRWPNNNPTLTDHDGHDVSCVQRHDVSCVQRHDVSCVQRHYVSCVQRHDVSCVNGHDVSCVQRHDVSYVQRHDVSCVHGHDVSCVQRHDVSCVQRHDVSCVQRHDVSCVQRHDVSRDQEKHVIWHFGENDFFQKNMCLVHSELVDKIWCHFFWSLSGDCLVKIFVFLNLQELIRKNTLFSGNRHFSIFWSGRTHFLQEKDIKDIICLFSGKNAFFLIRMGNGAMSKEQWCVHILWCQCLSLTIQITRKASLHKNIFSYHLYP